MEFIHIAEHTGITSAFDSFSPESFEIKKTTLEVPSRITIFTYKKFDSYYNQISMRYEYQGKWHEAVILISDHIISSSTPQAITDVITDLLAFKISKNHTLHSMVRKHTENKIRSILTADNSMADEYKALLQNCSPTHDDVSEASKKLPGMKFIVEVPCVCPLPPRNLWNVVQHLNDKHKDWTRERIADWLDALHDSGRVNLEFEPWEAQDMES